VPYVIRLKDGTEIVAETALDLAKALQSLGLRPATGIDRHPPERNEHALELSVAQSLLALLTHVAGHKTGTTAPAIAKVLGLNTGRAVSGRKSLWESILNDLGFEYNDVVRMERVRGQRYWFPGKYIDRAILKLKDKIS
jgi:hypothetical protein